jgi:hypothetical protein
MAIVRPHRVRSRDLRRGKINRKFNQTFKFAGSNWIPSLKMKIDVKFPGALQLFLLNQMENFGSFLLVFVMLGLFESSSNLILLI